MRSFFSIPVLIVCLSAFVSSQTSNDAVAQVMWDSSSTCSASNRDEIKKSAPWCDRVETKQGVFYIIAFRGISVAFSPVPRPKYIRALAQITNRSGSEILFDPMESSVDVYEDEEAFLARVGRKETLGAITSREAKKRLGNGQDVISTVSLSTATAPGTPNQRGTKTYTWDKNGRLTNVGSGVTSEPASPGESRLTVLDPKSAAALSPPSMTSTPMSNASKRTTSTLIFDQAIIKQTLPDQKKTAGYMFFDPIRETKKYFVFKIGVGDVFFIFPEDTTPVTN